jgi:hypothetical protein
MGRTSHKISLAAGSTEKAVPSVPSNTDVGSYGRPLDTRSNCNNMPYDFVARYTRILNRHNVMHSDFITEADATGSHFNQHLVICRGWDLSLLKGQLAVGFFENSTLVCIRHDRLSRWWCFVTEGKEVNVIVSLSIDKMRKS